MKRVFIDGEAGTTGLLIRERLAGRRDIELLQIDPARRKEADERKRMLNAADVVFLCLPDEAAIEAVSLIDNPDVAVIDASTAHRVADDWTYGLPEMTKTHRETVAASKRISNPGCYPTGAVALARPLVEAGILPTGFPLTINAVSGYSGGGKGMIAEFEDPQAPKRSEQPFRLYALTLEHKHVPEMQKFCRLDHKPLFAPSVGRYRQGMLVEVPLQLWSLPGKVTPAQVREALGDAYSGERFVQVATAEETAGMANIDPEGLNHTNGMKLFVFANEATEQVRLVAQLDNLGKGASGAAVQNMNLMLGLDEAAGLLPE
ncbi:MAG: N-acetyl-gamma-glutamyl-phosphate reductase [Parvibaculaceae bacterium]